MDDLGTAPPDRLGTTTLPDGRSLAWSEWGPVTGRAVLFFPGAATGRSLGFGTHLLPGLDVRLVSWDRPGLGASDPAPGWTLADAAADVAALVADRGLTDVHGVAFSQGSVFGLACAAAGVLSRLSIVSGTDDFADPVTADRADPGVARFCAACRDDPRGTRAQLEAMDAASMWDLVLQGSSDVDAQVYRQPGFAAAYSGALAEGFAQSAAGYARDTVLAMAPWSFDVESLALPVDLWFGAHDGSAVHSPDRGERLHARIPGSRRHVVADAGGSLLWTRARDVLTAPVPTRPTTPDGSYLEGVRTGIDRAAATATPLRSAHAGAPAALLDATEAAVEAAADDLLALSHDLHAHPEEAFAEHRSARAVADLLARHGVGAAVGVHGLDTALRASVSHGDGPTVAVLAEYDALPGLGHGCGHNVICATAVGAFLGLAHALRSGAAGGTAVLLGTPAEEGGGGKEFLARAGAFDGVDAVVMLHPFSYDVAAQPFLGRRQVRATYHGVAAHAAAQPFMGRNALDAVVAGYNGIAMLRQHTTPDDRVHGIVLDGGRRPNVVPDRAVAEYYVRSAEPATLADLCARVDLVLRAAAAMTGTGVELEWDRQPAYLPIRANLELAARWTAHQARRGRTSLPPGVVPTTLTGSTDLGNVSVRVPAIHPMLAVSSPDVSLHTAAFAAAAASPAADAAVLDGAVGLALTALDVLADPGLLAAVRAEFEAAGGVMDVEGFLG